jgi:hypothetical protein
MRDFATMGNLAVWYAHVDARTMQQVLAVQLAEAERKLLVKTLAKAQKRDHLQALGKLTRVIDGEHRFISDPPLVVPITELLSDLESHELDGQLQKLIRGYGRSLQGPPRGHRAVPGGRHRPQGRRRRQRRHSHVGHAAAGPGRPIVPAGEGSPAVGAGSLRRQEST